jgi:preprotein translocase subunit SecD
MDMENARTLDARRLAVDLSGQPDGDWSRTFDEERRAVLREEGVDYIEIVLGNDTIQVNVLGEGTLDNATEVLREIVKRTNARTQDEAGTE